eukprot:COSAG06_NODE_45834_length_351_cov_1.634921_1_plen_32_part_01
MGKQSTVCVCKSKEETVEPTLSHPLLHVHVDD